MLCEISFETDGVWYKCAYDLPFYPRKGDILYFNGVELVVNDRVYFDLGTRIITCCCDVYQVLSHDNLTDEALQGAGWTPCGEDDK